MSKRRLRRYRRKRRRRSSSHRAAQSAITLERYVEQADPPAWAARALRAALPGGLLPTSSNWILDGVERARQACSSDPLAILDVLFDFAAWCYARDPARQHDLAIELAQVELCRRRHGADPRPVAFPEPSDPDFMDARRATGLVAQWEAASYARGLEEPDDPPDIGMRFFAVALSWTSHLADVGGVPIRPEQLDPAAFARDLEELPATIGEIARPRGFLSMVLAGVSELYDRLADRGMVDEELARAIAEELLVLAVLYDEDAEPAVA